MQKLDQIVQEVKESEEWEAVQMDILEIGLEHGRKLGMEEGREDGLERYNSLIQFLIKDDRMDDIIKAANDRAFQESLFKECGL